MQFIVMGYDGEDSEAAKRRLDNRTAHLDMVTQMVESGNDLYACALKNEEGDMIGSMIVTEFESRKDLDAWLAKEPYVLGKVWEKIDVIPCSVAPAFAKNKN